MATIKNLVWVIVFTLLCSCADTEQDKKQIYETYDNYKAALLDKKGEVAVEYIDSVTINYYNGILKSTMFADSAKVSAMPISDKYMVLRLRGLLSLNEIQKMDGKKVLVFAINKGMIGKQSVEKGELGYITVEGNYATAEFETGGKTTGLKHEFNKEDGKWKLNLTSMMPIVNVAFEEMIKKSETTPNSFVEMLANSFNSNPVNKNIWQPLANQRPELRLPIR